MSKSDEEILREMKAVCEAEPLGRGFQDRWLRAAYRVARAHVLDEAAAVLNQAADEANAECDHAHYEGDTGAWVCTRRGGCDCEAIQYQADKHRTAILALKDRTP